MLFFKVSIVKLVTNPFVAPGVAPVGKLFVVTILKFTAPVVLRLTLQGVEVSLTTRVLPGRHLRCVELKTTEGTAPTRTLSLRKGVPLVT